MESHLQTLMEIIQNHPGIREGERSECMMLLKEADKKLAIAEFKLDRTEKVKRTTAILLEETIEELEFKRKAIEETNVALQKSLEELKAAQAQLVQAEKMASLGELTAGIAHEIQNPLNFVNNFSEVSKELIDEMNDELAAGNYDLAKEIASDIEQNLVKIHHHGKRADSIVKGMLQHSRTSSGQRELTDINVLAEEYLRLSYHGLKSRIKDFNTSLNTDLEPGLPKLSIVPQDIGRVVLNLVNNAFYAVHEKSKSGITGYMPAVTVKTLLNGNYAEINVSDNGPGIPATIREKIFQPFFTTKPTGEGTGLGLSLSYDILKAHGGELLLESIEGQGTTFYHPITNTVKMKQIQNREQEALKVYHHYWDCYSNGDLEGFASVLDEDFELIGTSETEVAHNKAEGIQFYKAQMHELVGKVDHRNRIISVRPFKDLVLINETSDIYVLGETGWVFYSGIRISTLLHETKYGLKVIQQHGSFPDMRVQEGETLAIEKITRENLQLKDAVKRRTAELEIKNRELEIEAALEKVRSRSLTMHKSEEIQNVVEEVFKRLNELGVGLDTANILIFRKNDEFIESWTASNNINDFRTRFLIPASSVPHFAEIISAADKGHNLISRSYGVEEKNKWFNFLFTQTDYKYIPEERKEFILNSPLSTFSVGLYGNIGIQLTSYSRESFTHEENNILIRFTKVFEQSYTRFLDLQKAEAQTREAQIEAALERVRSRAMAMQKSDELLQVIKTLSEQLRQLGLHAEAVSFLTDGDEKGYNMWLSSPDEDFLSKIFVPRIQDRTTLLFIEAKESGKKYYSYVLSKEEKDIYFRNFFDNTVLRDYPDSGKEQVFAAPGLTTTNVLLDSIVLSVSNFGTLPYTDQENEIINRVALVFQQSYTRFLDLQKAEAQAKESQIEAALERVRSKSLAMHHSEDLEQVIGCVFEMVVNLGIAIDGALLLVFNKDSRDVGLWIASVQLTRPVYIDLPYEEEMKDNEVILDYWDTIKVQGHILNKAYSGVAKNDYFRYVQRHNGLKIPDPIRELQLSMPAWNFTFVAGSNTILGLDSWSGHQFSESDLNTLKRFSRVFEQAYIRFLDLQRAEAQTREAQIEAALEKVRSRSLAMQSPDELMNVAHLLREEMGALGVEELETSSIFIHQNDSGQTQCWFTIKNTEEPARMVSDRMILNLNDTWVGRQMIAFYLSKDESTSIVMHGQHRIEWIRYCEAKSPLLGTSNFYGDTIPDRTYHLYKFSDGFLGAAAPGQISNESRDLLRRATAVFSFAYTRFLDLQKAEASALAAIRQASLDRVRADISSMRHASDLDRITPLVFNELTILGIPFIRCGVFIIHEEGSYVDVHLSTPAGESLAAMKLPLDSSELTRLSMQAWKRQEVYTRHWNKDDFVNWVNSLQQHGYIQDRNAYQGKEAPPESLELHFVPFSQGLLYVGSERPLSNDQIDLVKALARSFAIAYARYEDFVQLEKAKADIEHAMTELKATQSQLVQQEKLASLGQLTAGIAHEIKNPLNFINNFSEVSAELVDEVYEELLQSVKTENKDDLLAILSDVKSNLNIIRQHGLRADGIVRSMLMHSRTSSGHRQSSDLNALVTENVNLAYHGMRAGKDPIQVRTLLQLDESVGEVPVIIEDFSRVILNLCANAFDAMREKWKQYATQEVKDLEEGEQVEGHYFPQLVVRTRRQGTSVVIEVEDNGTGIPDDIRENILQPFFTTKKGTQGTGLGLSITHDIVKAHGGKLEIETTLHVFTRFIISLI